MNNNFLHIKCDTSAVFDVTFLPPFAAKIFFRGVRPPALRAALGEWRHTSMTCAAYICAAGTPNSAQFSAFILAVRNIQRDSEMVSMSNPLTWELYLHHWHITLVFHNSGYRVDNKALRTRCFYTFVDDVIGPNLPFQIKWMFYIRVAGQVGSFLCIFEWMVVDLNFLFCWHVINRLRNSTRAMKPNIIYMIAWIHETCRYQSAERWYHAS